MQAVSLQGASSGGAGVRESEAGGRVPGGDPVSAGQVWAKVSGGDLAQEHHRVFHNTLHSGEIINSATQLMSA